MEEYLIITFEETTMALYMERICKREKKEGRMIPLPKAIDAGCGLAWATRERDEEVWKRFLERENIAYERMVEVEL
ncbi:MAG: DUF3343 domain-containing protein [Lachnospiraceae bacterium]|nr:DUF3343 domain-containing protein [Lachnospiraceae bacterium]